MQQIEYLLRVCIEDTCACAGDSGRSKTRPDTFKGLGVCIDLGRERAIVETVGVEVVVREGKEHAVADTATSANSV